MKVLSFITSLPRRTAMFLIEYYQQCFSSRRPPTCKFTPTCSEYTRIAIDRYGVVRGVWIGMRRILRCHPWSKGGFDPVP